MHRDSPRLCEVFALCVNSLHLRTTQVLVCGSIVSTVSCLEGGLWGMLQAGAGGKSRDRFSPTLHHFLLSLSHACSHF